MQIEAVHISIGEVMQLLATTTAIVALIKGLREYSAQVRLRRFESFQTIRRRLKENAEFQRVLALCEHNDPALAEISFAMKRDLLGLFEEVAVMVNSRLMRPQMAQYFFGYYALRIEDAGHFWANVDRTTQYWSIFFDFVARMREVEQRFHQPAYSPRIAF